MDRHLREIREIEISQLNLKYAHTRIDRPKERIALAASIEAFGTVERVRKLYDEDVLYGRGKKKAEIIKKRPGVSPEAIGRYLLDKAVFVRLADVIEGLPPYDENVIVHSMEGRQAEEYARFEIRLRNAVSQYKMRATSSMLQALLSYPDSCTSFPEYIEKRERHCVVLFFSVIYFSDYIFLLASAKLSFFSASRGKTLQ
ncbi:MAG: hypothetical protein A4E57_02066 [Syntrophorhabdaceae bacterium PtaU1.Bin034]|nr:MAG: hypothetical protein A4E57_02066 [Syntrophorhabdaceae bacterium PtaU1.Bin034]